MKRLFLGLLALPGLCFAQTAETWMQKPVQAWPQIALVNDVLYKNGDKYEDPTITYGASGFLLDTGKDTLAVSAKHILWVARNKASKQVVINEQLKSWKMYPKHNPADSVVIDRLLNEDPTEKLWDGPDNGVLQRDWIVFSTKSISPNIQPLKLREKPVSAGESVYLTGNPYRFKQTLTAKGQVVKTEGPVFYVEFQGVGMDTVFLGGASGSPIIDANGKLIGIYSNGRTDGKTGKRVNVISSTDYLKKVLAGTQPLNVNRKPVSEYLDSLLHRETVQKALPVFDRFRKTESSFYQYELTYLNHDAILKTGEKLIGENRKEEAVLYFDYFVKNFDYHGYLMSLAKTWVLVNRKPEAIKRLETEVKKPDIDPYVKDELEKLLADIVRRE
ncbi:S1 family peptidase [Larkinella rosea]|uniref:Serine protease n=1 Tax=Larkinella rosea TaxID=2025312 RepID=A0A3P1BFI8_9BACT|nr:serine protease [Larkinella rosea]RRA99794.1 serine protease [Larkinella rosea]